MNAFFTRAMWCAIILFAIRCLISLGQIKKGINFYDLFGFAGEAIAIASLLMVLYEKKLWRYDPTVKIPYIAGMYEGTLKSKFDEMERTANLEIKQSMLSIEVLLKTDESISRSVSGTIEEIFGEYELIYTYLNEPKAKVRDRSSIHFGTASFVLDKVEQIQGKYYTDRKTIGDMEFQKVSD